MFGRSSRKRKEAEEGQEQRDYRQELIHLFNHMDVFFDTPHKRHTALAIGKRVGHSAEKITYRYAHLFPSVQQDMAEQLDAENMDEELNEVEGGLANVG